jgi:hypothetical protein
MMIHTQTQQNDPKFRSKRPRIMTILEFTDKSLTIKSDRKRTDEEINSNKTILDSIVADFRTFPHVRYVEKWEAELTKY